MINKALQTKAQALAQSLNEEAVFVTKGTQHVQVKAGNLYTPVAKIVTHGNELCAGFISLKSKVSCLANP